VSHFEIIRGHVYLRDEYRGKLIYTHYAGDWRGFTNGGTMRNLIIHLRDYIRTGAPQKMNLGPWPEWICDGDLWGYGDDMQTVRQAAARLGILAA